MAPGVLFFFVVVFLLFCPFIFLVAFNLGFLFWLLRAQQMMDVVWKCRRLEKSTTSRRGEKPWG